MTSLDELMPRVLPPAWREMPGARIPIAPARAYENAFGLHVIATVEDRGADTGWWLHVSMSRRSKLPSWSDVREVKAKRGQLNPDLSRWLMGYPVAWLFAAPSNRPKPRFKGSTAAESSSIGTTARARSRDSETPSSRSSQRSSSKRRSPRARR